MPQCKLPNCPIATDGKCLEGRGLECPNLIRDPVQLPENRKPVVQQPAVSSAIAFEPLPGIPPLEVSEARYFSRRGRASVVAFAGMPDCGKTSLLARLHQLFLSGPLAGFDFCGSRSLPRFEELNWRSTIESGVPQPDMLHSSAQFDNSFVHLAVRPTSGGERIDLLLNDIAGETFKRAVEVQSVCEKLQALGRADHLVVLMDGAILAHDSARHNHLNQTRDFLQRIIQGGQCGAQSSVHLVISKLDKLGTKVTVADKLQEDFDKSFRAKLGSLDFCRIAARPMDGSLPTTETIGKLFARWAQTTLRYPPAVIPSVRRDAWAREFCRFDV